MRPGLEIETSAEASFIVTPDMRAAFEGQVVHDALSTASMIVWMEWASRKIILPFLEPHEEGVGAEVSVRHLAPTPVGASVTCRAVVTSVSARQVVTRVEAHSLGSLIGQGTVTQAIITRERFEERLRAARESLRTRSSA